MIWYQDETPRVVWKEKMTQVNLHSGKLPAGTYRSPKWKGKSSEPSTSMFGFQPLIFQGVVGCVAALFPSTLQVEKDNLLFFNQTTSLTGGSFNIIAMDHDLDFLFYSFLLLFWIVSYDSTPNPTCYLSWINTFAYIYLYGFPENHDKKRRQISPDSQKNATFSHLKTGGSWSGWCRRRRWPWRWNRNKKKLEPSCFFLRG